MSNSCNRTFIVGLIITMIGYCFSVGGIILGVFGVVASFGGGVSIAIGIGISMLALIPFFAPVILSGLIDFARLWDVSLLDAFFGVFITIGVPVMVLGIFLAVRAAKTLAPK